MKSIEIENIKNLTTALFTGTNFDEFLVTEAYFSTLFDVSIEGHINADFLNDEEKALPENQEGSVSWGRIRGYCFELIKGRKTPLKFKIVFRMPSNREEGFIRKYGLNFEPEDINGLFLNVNYEAGKMRCVTGTSLRTFTLDKSLEDAWDKQMEKFISSF